MKVFRSFLLHIILSCFLFINISNVRAQETDHGHTHGLLAIDSEE